MVTYEIISFVHGEWCGSCGKFNNLDDAIEHKLRLDAHKEYKYEHFHIVVRL